jgi:HD-GYP domain-containing protein (c-di-GMP phosphodiesterase class II)
MLRVPIAQARAGMVLALPLYHPRRHDTVLLNPGITLDERSVARLQELRVSELWIRYPGMDLINEYISPELVEQQASLTSRISGAFDAVIRGAHARLDFGGYSSAIASLVSRLLSSPKAAIFINEMADRDEPALRHGSGVCLMSVMMGLKLEDYLVAERSRLGAASARDVSSLGVGAMMHDIGMLRLPPEVVERWNQTQDESDAAWREHVQIGFDLVKDAVGPAAAASVLHHHQKFDGSGFPLRPRQAGPDEPVRGSDIHIFARIIAATDLFDRLRHPPGGGGGDACVPVVRALRWMQQEPYCRWIDPIVYKALLAVVPAYAPGSFVELSDGRACAVVEWLAHDPCRPTVQPIGDPSTGFDRSPPRAERIALTKCPGLSIVRAEGQDVAADNFYPVNPGQYDLRLTSKSLINAAAGQYSRAG